MKFCEECGRFISSQHQQCPYCEMDLLRKVELRVNSKELPFQQLHVGEKLYTLEGLIKSGGFGYVFKAREEPDGREVALKLPFRLLAAHGKLYGVPEENLKASEESIEREIENLKRFHHPAIIRMLHWGKVAVPSGEGEVPVLVLELASGNVEELMSSLSLSLEERMKIARAAVDALAYLHQQGFVYRDMSLKNLLMVEREDGEVYPVLADFGASKGLVRTSDGSTRAVGTQRYMHPSYLLNPKEWSRDPRIDVFSLAVVILELVIGVPNWTKLYADEDVKTPLDKPLSEVIIQQMKEERLSGQLAELLLRSTSENIEEIPADASQFRERFDQILEATLVPSPPPEEYVSRSFEIPFAAIIKLPLPPDWEDKTFRAASAEAREGRTVLLDDPRGIKIKLPFEMSRRAKVRLDGPPFYEVIKADSRTLYLRLQHSRLKQELRAFREEGFEIEGEMEFEGKILVED